MSDKLEKIKELASIIYDDNQFLEIEPLEINVAIWLSMEIARYIVVYNFPIEYAHSSACFKIYTPYIALEQSTIDNINASLTKSIATLNH